MTQLATPNQYEAVFPAFPCGTNIRYYVSVDTTSALPINSPNNAPASYHSSVSAAGAGPDVFVDNFQNNLGWTVSNSAGLTTGQWQRGVPVTPAPSGAPGSDGDGSGSCYVTHNSTGNFDIDGGSTTLTSPIMDASVGIPVLSYYRWYSNNTGNSPQADTMVVEISSNGGGSWITLETVGPSTASPNPEVTGGWFQKSFNLASIGGFALTNQFRIRFTASDLGSGSLVEAGVDGVKIGTLECVNPNPCPSDLTNDGQVGVGDLLMVINSWGPCPGCPADLDGDNQVSVPDLLEIINNWGACP
jgi:aminopeptidase S